MAEEGFYRRALPSPPAIDFSSPEGKILFTEALHNGNAEGFFKLISNFQTQSEPAYCGLASLAMVLNALAIDPCKKWKGPWRWFDESMLDICEPLEKIKAKGISFGKVVCLAHCAGAKVEAFRTDQSSIDDFRKYVIACSKSDECHLISSYNRKAFQQTGTGHFSPIGGYHAETDMVLILDVARFKYPPHWVPIPLLWEAMDTVVPTTGMRRGFMLVSRPRKAPALLYTLSCIHESWISTAKYLTDDVPMLLSSNNVKDIKDVISAIFSYLPSDFTEFIKWVEEVRIKEDSGQALSQEEKGRIAIKEEVLKLVQETALYKQVTDTVSSEHCFSSITEKSATTTNTNEEHKAQMLAKRENPSSNVILTALLLALPPQTWSVIMDQQVHQQISSLVSRDNLPSLLRDEIVHLRGQLLLLKRCKDDKVEHDLDAPLI